MRIGISDCLLGTKCRYDGQHKRSRFVTDVLSRHATFLPFCPEGATIGTPRESMYLVRSESGPRAITQKSGLDHTDKLLGFNREAIANISAQNLCGFIFKAKSPSCGLERVKLYTADHQPTDETAQGLFARAITEAFPMLPVEEEGRLEDPWLRENFMMQIFAYQRWLDFEASGPQMRDLVAFHARHKFLLLGKNEVHYRTLGRLVANHDKRTLSDLLAEYRPLFLQTIGEKSSLKSTLNQLQHLYGFVKKLVDEAEKASILESIDHCSQRVIPLIVPLKLIELAARKHQVTYLLDQHYLSPYPQELGLRSDLKSSR